MFFCSFFFPGHARLRSFYVQYIETGMLLPMHIVPISERPIFYSGSPAVLLKYAVGPRFQLKVLWPTIYSGYPSVLSCRAISESLL